MSVSAIRFEDVSVRYLPSGPAALQSVSFTVGECERVGLLGLTGSGKTTVLLAACGLVRFDGRISICGIEICRKTLSDVRAKLGLLFSAPQDQLLLPKVIEDVAFGPLSRGLDRRLAVEKAMACLERLGIAGLAERSVHALSHGQRQLVALAGIMACEPAVLLLDEPSAGLDPVASRHLRSILKELDAAMLIATHDVDLASSLCTRCIVLDGGRIIHDGDISFVKRLWDL